MYAHLLVPCALSRLIFPDEDRKGRKSARLPLYFNKENSEHLQREKKNIRKVWGRLADVVEDLVKSFSQKKENNLFPFNIIIYSSTVDSYIKLSVLNNDIVKNEISGHYIDERKLSFVQQTSLVTRLRLSLADIDIIHEYFKQSLTKEEYSKAKTILLNNLVNNKWFRILVADSIPIGPIWNIKDIFSMYFANKDILMRLLPGIRKNFQFRRDNRNSNSNRPFPYKWKLTKLESEKEERNEKYTNELTVHVVINIGDDSTPGKIKKGFDLLTIHFPDREDPLAQDNVIPFALTHGDATKETMKAYGDKINKQFNNISNLYFTLILNEEILSTIEPTIKGNTKLRIRIINTATFDQKFCQIIIPQKDNPSFQSLITIADRGRELMDKDYNPHPYDKLLLFQHEFEVEYGEADPIYADFIPRTLNEYR